MNPVKIKSTDECAGCRFQEYEGYDCLIPEQSGFKDEDVRHFCDDEGYDAWKPCHFRLTWEDATEIVLWFLSNCRDSYEVEL